MHRILIIAATLLFFSFHPSDRDAGGKWISLFDGESFNGWKVGTNKESFSILGGTIRINGNVGHLYYDGAVGNHDFTNFEFKADVKTEPGSNSGIYFHTLYQESSWPKKGYEVQVNNSHTDWRRSGSLWAIQDVKETYAKDFDWFTLHIKVKNKRVTVSINSKQIVDYTEPPNAERSKGMEERLLSSGTFALQAHDPKSTVYYKNIKVKILD